MGQQKQAGQLASSSSPNSPVYLGPEARLQQLINTMSKEQPEAKAQPGSLKSKTLRKAEVLGMETRNISGHWLAPLKLHSKVDGSKPVPSPKDSIQAEYSITSSTAARVTPLSPRELYGLRASRIVQDLGRTALFSHSPYVDSALEILAQTGIPADITSPGKCDVSAPPRRTVGKLTGANRASAVQRARRMLSHTTPFKLQVPFSDAVRVASKHNDHHWLLPLLDAYLISNHNLTGPQLEQHCQVLARQPPTVQLQAVSIMVQHGFYFAAVKVVFHDPELLKATLEELQLITHQDIEETQWEVAVQTWKWQELDKQLLMQQFNHLRLISTYKDARRLLKNLGSQGIPALVKIERELLAKVVDDFLAQLQHELEAEASAVSAQNEQAAARKQARKEAMAARQAKARELLEHHKQQQKTIAEAAKAKVHQQRLKHEQATVAAREQARAELDAHKATHAAAIAQGAAEHARLLDRASNTPTSPYAVSKPRRGSNADEVDTEEVPSMKATPREADAEIVADDEADKQSCNAYTDTCGDCKQAEEEEYQPVDEDIVQVEPIQDRSSAPPVTTITAKPYQTPELVVTPPEAQRQSTASPRNRKQAAKTPPGSKSTVQQGKTKPANSPVPPIPAPKEVTEHATQKVADSRATVAEPAGLCTVVDGIAVPVETVIRTSCTKLDKSPRATDIDNQQGDAHEAESASTVDVKQQQGNNAPEIDAEPVNEDVARSVVNVDKDAALAGNTADAAAAAAGDDVVEKAAEDVALATSDCPVDATVTADDDDSKPQGDDVIEPSVQEKPIVDCETQEDNDDGSQADGGQDAEPASVPQLTEDNAAPNEHQSNDGLGIDDGAGVSNTEVHAVEVTTTKAPHPEEETTVGQESNIVAETETPLQPTDADNSEERATNTMQQAVVQQPEAGTEVGSAVDNADHHPDVAASCDDVVNSPEETMLADDTYNGSNAEEPADAKAAQDSEATSEPVLQDGHTSVTNLSESEPNPDEQLDDSTQPAGNDGDLPNDAPADDVDNLINQEDANSAEGITPLDNFEAQRGIAEEAESAAGNVEHGDQQADTAMEANECDVAFPQCHDGGADDAQQSDNQADCFSAVDRHSKTSASEGQEDEKEDGAAEADCDVDRTSQHEDVQGNEADNHQDEAVLGMVNQTEERVNAPETAVGCIPGTTAKEIVSNNSTANEDVQGDDSTCGQQAPADDDTGMTAEHTCLDAEPGAAQTQPSQVDEAEAAEQQLADAGCVQGSFNDDEQTGPQSQDIEAANNGEKTDEEMLPIDATQKDALQPVEQSIAEKDDRLSGNAKALATLNGSGLVETTDSDEAMKDAEDENNCTETAAGEVDVANTTPTAETSNIDVVADVHNSNDKPSSSSITTDKQCPADQSVDDQCGPEMDDAMAQDVSLEQATLPEQVTSGQSDAGQGVTNNDDPSPEVVGKQQESAEGLPETAATQEDQQQEQQAEDTDVIGENENSACALSAAMSQEQSLDGQPDEQQDATHVQASQPAEQPLVSDAVQASLNEGNMTDEQAVITTADTAARDHKISTDSVEQASDEAVDMASIATAEQCQNNEQGMQEQVETPTRAAGNSPEGAELQELADEKVTNMEPAKHPVDAVDEDQAHAVTDDHVIQEQETHVEQQYPEETPSSTGVETDMDVSQQQPEQMTAASEEDVNATKEPTQQETARMQGVDDESTSQPAGDSLRQSQEGQKPSEVERDTSGSSEMPQPTGEQVEDRKPASGSVDVLPTQDSTTSQVDDMNTQLQEGLGGMVDQADTTVDADSKDGNGECDLAGPVSNNLETAEPDTEIGSANDQTGSEQQESKEEEEIEMQEEQPANVCEQERNSKQSGLEAGSMSPDTQQEDTQASLDQPPEATAVEGSDIITDNRQADVAEDCNVPHSSADQTTVTQPNVGGIDANDEDNDRQSKAAEACDEGPRSSAASGSIPVSQQQASVASSRGSKQATPRSPRADSKTHTPRSSAQRTSAATRPEQSICSNQPCREGVQEGLAELRKAGSVARQQAEVAAAAVTAQRSSSLCSSRMVTPRQASQTIQEMVVSAISAAADAPAQGLSTVEQLAVDAMFGDTTQGTSASIDSTVHQQPGNESRALVCQEDTPHASQQHERSSGRRQTEELLETVRNFQEQLAASIMLSGITQHSGSPPTPQPQPIPPAHNMKDINEEPPSQDEIHDYARYLGMDVEQDAHLLYIAEWALTAPVPEGWTVHLDRKGNEFFYNAVTNKSTYEHPMDQHYKQFYVQKKAEGKERKSEADV